MKLYNTDMLRTSLLIALSLLLSHVDNILTQPTEKCSDEENGVCKDNILVKGEITFIDKTPNTFPPASCIWYRLYSKSDSKLVQEREVVIAYVVEYVGDMRIQNGHKYTIELSHSSYNESVEYFIAADIFVGRCPHINFIKEIWNDHRNPGDYGTRFEHKAIIKGPKSTNFLQLSYFCWHWDCEKNPMTMTTYCYDNLEQTVIVNGERYQPMNSCEDCVCVDGRLDCAVVTCKNAKDSCSKDDILQDSCCPCDIGIQTHVKVTEQVSFEESNSPGKLPDGSCITFKVKTKVGKVVFAEVRYVGGETIESNAEYSLFFDRPMNSVSTYSLVVIINYGWCPNNNGLYKEYSTVSDGDYENKEAYTMVVIPSESTYTMKVALKRQCTRTNCDIVQSPRHCFDNEQRLRSDESSWKEGTCTHCKCSKGIRQCATQRCTLNCRRDEAVRKTGECCPVCPHPGSCFDLNTNQTFSNGQHWQRDSCTKCFCMSGFAMCAATGCHLPHCGPDYHHVKVKGLCCPVCNNQNICEYNGAKFVEGNYWQKEDCQICRCIADGEKCFDPMLDLTQCKSPVWMHPTCSKFCLPPYTSNEP